MHRLIMTSTVYRQSSQREPSKDAVDTDNALLGRYPVRRLDAESLRDSILAAGRAARPDACSARRCRSSRTPWGRSIPANDSPRRSLYLQVRRTQPVSLLAAFDAPVDDGQLRPPRPQHHAPQSLDAHEQRLRPEPGRGHRRADPGPDARGRASTTRSPRPGGSSTSARSPPRSWTGRGLSRPSSSPRSSAPGPRAIAELAVLTSLCQQLLTSNEFLYVD